MVPFKLIYKQIVIFLVVGVLYTAGCTVKSEDDNLVITSASLPTITLATSTQSAIAILIPSTKLPTLTATHTPPIFDLALTPTLPPTVLPTATMPSVTLNDNLQANAPSIDPDGRPPSISSDGRWIVFASYASNLVPNDTNSCPSQWANQGGNCLDIFAYDQETGATKRISVASDGTQANGESFAPAITPDGKWVIFRSLADNLVPGFAEICVTRDYPDSCSGIFIHNLETSQTELLVVISGGRGPDVNNYLSISANGRFVAFWSMESTLVEGISGANLFVYDRQRNEAKAVLATDYSIETGQTCEPPELPNEEWVAFTCLPGSIFVYEWQTEQFVLVNASDNTLSFDNQWAVFSSEDNNLVSDDTNECNDVQHGLRNCADVFVRNLQTGELERISIDNAGTQGNGDSFYPTITSDGRFVTFMSNSSNFADDDTIECGVGTKLYNCFDIFVYDRDTNTIERISNTNESVSANENSRWPRISADGRWVVFISWANNLVPNDTNGVPDVFMYDRSTGTIERANTVGISKN